MLTEHSHSQHARRRNPERDAAGGGVCLADESRGCGAPIGESIYGQSSSGMHGIQQECMLQTHFWSISGRFLIQSSKAAQHSKQLRGVIDAMLHHAPPPGWSPDFDTVGRLRLGPDCDEGLNVGRITEADWAAAAEGGETRTEEEATRAFTVAGLLESIEPSEEDLPLADIPSGLKTQPLPYQRQGVAWMLQREALAAAAAAPGTVAAGPTLPLPPPVSSHAILRCL